MLKLMYKELVIGTVVANHSMSIDDVLELLEIDMDEFARKNGFDDWDFDDLQIEIVRIFKVKIFNAKTGKLLGKLPINFEAENKANAVARAYSYLAFYMDMTQDIINDIYVEAYEIA